MFFQSSPERVHRIPHYYHQSYKIFSSQGKIRGLEDWDELCFLFSFPIHHPSKAYLGVVLGLVRNNTLNHHPPVSHPFSSNHKPSGSLLGQGYICPGSLKSEPPRSIFANWVLLRAESSSAHIRYAWGSRLILPYILWFRPALHYGLCKNYSRPGLSSSAFALLLAINTNAM